MSYNIPTASDNDISFGPGILSLGAAGATPTSDIGFITEDGVTIEMQSEKRTIMQGNARVPLYTFSQMQGVMVRCTGIHWNFTTFAQVLGAGTTSSGAGFEQFIFGGDPLVRRYACQVQHSMVQSGHTMYARIWRVVGEGGLTIPMGQDEHQFEYSLMAHRTTTDWASNALAAGAQLFALYRDSA